ncbi:MAG: hypothetical protein ACI976_000089, partial [Aureispira sp.]
MAIRFRPDNNSNDNNNNNNNNRRGGGGRNNSAMIMAVLMFVFRYPKVGIPLIIIGGIVFLFFGGESGTPPNPNSDIYNMSGCEISEEKYDESKVFAALSSSS